MTDNLGRLAPVTQSPTPASLSAADSSCARRSVRSRLRRRAAAAYAVALPLLAVASASPAMAESHYSDGESPGPGISVLQTLGVYVGIPLGIYLVLALLTFAPSTTRGPRYRPGSGWNADTAWLGGPKDTAGGTDTDASRAHGAGGASGQW